MKTNVWRCLMVAGGLACLWLAGQSSVWAEADQTLIAKGEKVYAEKRCGVCHMIKGKGGKVGGDLGGVGAKRDVSWLKAFIKDPKAVNAKSKMTPFKGTDDELEAVASYLLSLK
jgi:mono/diheme cytochrome c family protein